jgi:RHS repeat-associated protein
VEQVDMDGDGSLETSLWPVTDLLGTVELLTDGSGSIVERITYDPEGRPQVWSADTQRPRVTRVAWTGDGSDGRCPVGIPAVACPPAAFQLAFGEAVDGESAAGATASLTPQGGQPVPLTVTLTPDNRAAYLTGATVQAGTSYTLHLEGLRDRAGNLLWPFELTFTLTDPSAYQILEDAAPPRLLAALDAADGLYLAWEEPVEVASGFNLDTSIAVLRQGQLVQGTVSQLSPQLFRWQPVEESQWLAGGEYTLSAVHLQDLSGKAATAPSLSFTHMAGSNEVAYLVYQAPSDSQPQPRSSYGLTTLFQGRSWHEDLGLYHYRARWYLPEAGVFAERDPYEYRDSVSPYTMERQNPQNFLDPTGLLSLSSIERKRIREDLLEVFPTLEGALAFASTIVGKNPRLGPILSIHLPLRSTAYHSFEKAWEWRYVYKSASGNLFILTKWTAGGYSPARDHYYFVWGRMDTVESSVLNLAHEASHRWWLFQHPKESVSRPDPKLDEWSERSAHFVGLSYALWLIDEGAARVRKPTHARDLVADLATEGRWDPEKWRTYYCQVYLNEVKIPSGYVFDHLEVVDRDDPERKARRVPPESGPFGRDIPRAPEVPR